MKTGQCIYITIQTEEVCATLCQVIRWNAEYRSAGNAIHIQSNHIFAVILCSGVSESFFREGLAMELKPSRV